MDNTKRLSREALYHLNNAVVGLREAMEDQLIRTSDIVLAMIFPMALVYVRMPVRLLLMSLKPLDELGGFSADNENNSVC